MSRRPGGVGVPLLTLIVSFGIVLALGGVFGTSAKSEPGSGAGPTTTPAPTPPSPTASPPRSGVRITVDTDRLNPGDAVEPFPGGRLTLSTQAPGGPAPGAAGPPPSGEAVQLCLALPARWTLAGDGWSSRVEKNGETVSCRWVDRGSGKTRSVEIRLEQQP